MKRATILPLRNPRGSAIVVSLVFIAMFSALAAAMATFSNNNVQIAENLREVNTTRACAESGLDVVRYWISKVDMSGKIAPSQRFDHLATTLQSLLTAAGITNLVATYSGSTITFSDVPLLSSNAQSFSAVLTKLDNDNVRLEVTGHYGSLTRTLRTNFVFGETHNTVFDYGVVTKGPLSLSGNVDITGVVNVYSNAYIESLNTLLALEVGGNSDIAGTVKIVNPSAYVTVGSNATVGGDKGAAALQHITIGVTPSDFAEMDPNKFTVYATNLLDSSLDFKKAQTLTNTRIPAGTNPKFEGKVTINGVLYVELPNIVNFDGGVDITGVIVTNGSQYADAGSNLLNFSGNVSSRPVETLPAEFGTLRTMTGTFIMAPGCAVDFGGNFGTLNGAIAANGVTFSGNAGGTIQGSVINYSNTPMTLGGNSDLRFNRTDGSEVPAGFVPQIVLHYVASSYSEV